MNVHLIRTNGFESAQLKQIADLLNSQKKPLKFEYYDEPVSIINDEEKEFPVLWENLLETCNEFRQNNNLGEDYVVLITERPNAYHWFSFHDDSKNVFIHADDWSNYKLDNPVYPVAYQVIENILQDVMQLDLNQDPEEYAHMVPLGCMNDFCQQKSEIILKLRTGDICPDCLHSLEELEVDEMLIDQCLKLFELVRVKLLYRQGFGNALRNEKVIIDEDGNISIGSHVLNLAPLRKALYIFFLRHPNGLKFRQLESRIGEINRIYNRFDPRVENDPVAEMIENPGNNRFSSYRQQINDQIRDQLGSFSCLPFQIIKTEDQKYKIDIPDSQVIDLFQE